MRFLLGGGQQLVAEDLSNIIDLENYYGQSIDINQETKTITGDVTDAIINVDNNGELISKVSSFFGKTYINIKNDSNATFTNTNEVYNEVYIENPNFHINDSTAVFNESLLIVDDSDFTQPVIEKDNDFSGGGLSLDNSTLNIKKEAEFLYIDVLINHGSTATIDELIGYDSKIYVVNDSKLEINKDAEFDYESKIYVVNDSKLEINNAAFNIETHLIVKDNSNATINGALTVNRSDTIKIDKSNLNVGGVADFTDSALVVQNGSKVLFLNNFTMRNGSRAKKSIIILDNGSEINIKGDFENHGVIYYGASADNAPKITVDGKATLMGTTEIGVYATSGDISNLNQAVFLESKEAIENKATNDNIYAMYFDPDNEDANEEGLVKYDQNIIDAVLNLSEDSKKLLAQISMSDDMKNKPINEKIDFITESAQTADVNLTAQDLDIITSLFTIEDAKGNGLLATEVIKLAAQAAQGNQEAAQIISKTAQSIQQNSQDSITATSNLINTFNLATKNEVGKRISNVTTRSNVSQLANFIESLEGQKFADASSGVLLSMMADEMAAYQNSFYLNALGAKGDFKDGTNPKIYGAILGYDRMIDDLLIGGYFSYTNSQTENIELDSDIYELGLYSRYFLDNNEFDFNIAGGYGKNDLSYTQNIFGINKILQSNFNSSYIALGLDYGYRFAINDNASIKPYIGADYLYSKTQNYTLKDETGVDFQKVQSNTVKNLKANLGLEMVKNFDEISIYADAKIKRDLINDEGFTRSSFAGSSAGFNIKGNDKKHTNFAIDTGIAYNATKNLSINLNLGADVNSDDKIYSTSFGAAYKF